MRVRWNKQSKEQLIRTASYIRHEFGQDIMEEFMKEVKRTNRLLARNPYIGPVESLLSDLPIEYHTFARFTTILDGSSQTVLVPPSRLGLRIRNRPYLYREYHPDGRTHAGK